MRKYKLIQMFDVDKLYSYNYSTKEEVDENGVSTIIKDDSNADFNTLLDCHLSVFNTSNKEIWQSILAPNGFGELKTGPDSGVAQDIYEKTIGPNSMNYLSQQYQMMKMDNGAAGKAGIGVFSSGAMLLTLMQDNNVQYVAGANGVNEFKMEFDGSTSTGDLSGRMTLKGQKQQARSKTLEAFQSASVDNEKEQILFKINTNAHTFSTIQALAALGYDEETIAYFVSQPILREFAKEATNQSSSIREFSTDSKGTPIDVVKARYEEKLLKQHADIEYKKMSTSQKGFYKAATKGGVEYLDSMLSADVESVEYLTAQLAILNKFSELSDIGAEMQGVMQALNIDSKGVGKNFFIPTLREQKIEEFNGKLASFSGPKFFSGILGAHAILDNRIPGLVFNHTNKHTSKLTAEFSAISESFVVAPIISYLKNVFGRMGSSISAEAEFATEMMKEIKAYANSNPRLFGIADANVERQRLMIDDVQLTTEAGFAGQEYTKVHVKRPSLARIINAMQQHPTLSKNAFIATLETVLEKGNAPSVVKYRASTGVNSDESEIHEAFIELFRRNSELSIPMAGYDGSFTINTRDIALDLIKYAYLTGGVQEANQFVKYIPIDVLSYLGYDDNIGMSMNQLSGERTMMTDSGRITDSKVVDEIVQHKYRSVRTKLKSKMVVSDESEIQKHISEGIVPTATTSQLVQNDENGYFDEVKVISAFAPTDEAAYLKDKDGNYQPFVVVKSPAAGWLLYKYDGGQYRRIPILGDKNIREYGHTSGVHAYDSKSLFSDRNFSTEAKPTTSPDTSERISIPESSQSFLDEYDFSQDSPEESQGQIKKALNKLTNSTVKSYSNIARALLQQANEGVINSLNSVKVIMNRVDMDRRRGRARVDEFIEIFSLNGSGSPTFSSKEDLEKTVLHEIVHAFTSKAANILERRKANSLEFRDADFMSGVSDAIALSYGRIDSIRKHIKRSLIASGVVTESESKAMDKYMSSDRTESDRDAVKSGVSPNNRNLLYALSNTKEFMAEVLSAGDIVSVIDKAISNNVVSALGEMIGVDAKSMSDIIIKETGRFIKLISETTDSAGKGTGLSSDIDQQLSKVDKELDDIINGKEAEYEQVESSELVEAITNVVDTGLLYPIDIVNSKTGVRSTIDINVESDEGFRVKFTLDGQKVVVPIESEGDFKSRLTKILSNHNLLPFNIDNSEDFSLSTEESERLVKKHGEGAVEMYNQLSDEEKMAIIKCL